MSSDAPRCRPCRSSATEDTHLRNTRRQTGNWAEQAAAEFLLDQGLQLVSRNFSRKFGELDLIMIDGEILVFIEVRFRRNSIYGDGLSSVGVVKQRKIIAAAQAFLLSNPGLRFRACRFDVVAVSRTNYRPMFNWVSDAFSTYA